MRHELYEEKAKRRHGKTKWIFLC